MGMRCILHIYQKLYLGSCFNANPWSALLLLRFMPRLACDSTIHTRGFIRLLVLYRPSDQTRTQEYISQRHFVTLSGSHLSMSMYIFDTGPKRSLRLRSRLRPLSESWVFVHVKELVVSNFRYPC